MLFHYHRAHNRSSTRNREITHIGTQHTYVLNIVCWNWTKFQSAQKRHSAHNNRQVLVGLSWKWISTTGESNSLCSSFNGKCLSNGLRLLCLCVWIRIINKLAQTYQIGFYQENTGAINLLSYDFRLPAFHLLFRWFSCFQWKTNEITGHF